MKQTAETQPAAQNWEPEPTPQDRPRQPSRFQKAASFLHDRRYQVIGLVAVLLVWQIAALFIDLGDSFPGPLRVLPELWDLVASGSAWGPLFSTLGRTAAGFAIAFVLAILYGVLCYTFPAFRDYTSGLFNVVMFSPSLIVIFVGLIALGQTFTAVVFVVAFCIFTDVGVYMRDAFANFGEEIRSMTKAYKAGFWQRVTGVYLPFLAPAMLTTARSGFTLAWKTAFLAEIFAFPDGLGWELRSAYRIYDMPQMLAWLSLFIIALLLIEQLIRIIEKMTVRWAH